MNRGEFVRLTLTACKVDWEDERISFEDFFMKGRKKEMPNGKVPVLVVFGDLGMKKLDQTTCIVRYLCQKYGLYPTDILEIYEVEKIVEFLLDDLWSFRLT